MGEEAQGEREVAVCGRGKTTERSPSSTTNFWIFCARDAAFALALSMPAWMAAATLASAFASSTVVAPEPIAFIAMRQLASSFDVAAMRARHERARVRGCAGARVRACERASVAAVWRWRCGVGGVGLTLQGGRVHHDAEREQHGEELALVADQHRVAHHRAVRLDLVLDEHRRHVLAARRDDELLDAPGDREELIARAVSARVELAQVAGTEEA